MKQTFRVITPGHEYKLSDGTALKFRRHGADGKLVNSLTTCELLDLLRHRIFELNIHRPHRLNDETICLIDLAKEAQVKRNERVHALMDTLVEPRK